MQLDAQKFIDPATTRLEVCVVVGTRPGIIMMAPVIHELVRREVPHFVLHTGQHYSPAMDSELFEDLRLSQPAFHIKDVSARPTHGGQTAAMLEGCEAALIERRPRLVLVIGDANTNLAAALAARKLRLGVGHIEAGERSFDWRMPEEHNRRMIDHISDLLFTTNEKSAAQLRKEQVQGVVHVTGNTIVDASLNHANLARRHSDVMKRYQLASNRYVLMTSHREENVDDARRLAAIVEAAGLVARDLRMPVLFVAHPRTQKRLAGADRSQSYASRPDFRIIPSLRYLDFLQLLINAGLVLTDSGGVQQEAYIHRRACVTLRDNTEWTETLANGANRLAGADDAVRIVGRIREALANLPTSWPAIFGDGRAAERITQVAKQFIGSDARMDV